MTVSKQFAQNAWLHDKLKKFVASSEKHTVHGGPARAAGASPRPIFLRARASSSKNAWVASLTSHR